jgi:hypothetical protein
MNPTLATILGVIAGIATIAASFFVTRGILTCIFC